MGFPPRQAIPLSVLARNQTKDSWTWNLAVPGSGTGTRMRVGWTKEQRGSWRWTAGGSWQRDPAEGSWRWTAERRAAESWRVTTDRGSQHWTPETVGDKIGSSEEDRLKMSAFVVLVEFSLVTHASDSPHMHIVLHTFLCSWLTPSFVRVCPSIFSVPSIVFLCR